MEFGALPSESCFPARRSPVSLSSGALGGARAWDGHRCRQDVERPRVCQGRERNSATRRAEERERDPEEIDLGLCVCPCANIVTGRRDGGEKGDHRVRERLCNCGGQERGEILRFTEMERGK